MPGLCDPILIYKGCTGLAPGLWDLIPWPAGDMRAWLLAPGIQFPLVQGARGVGPRFPEPKRDIEGSFRTQFRQAPGCSSGLQGQRIEHCRPKPKFYIINKTVLHFVRISVLNVVHAAFKEFCSKKARVKVALVCYIILCFLVYVSE